MISGLLDLDLDLKESWHSDFEDLVYGHEVWHRVEVKLDSDEMQDISFLSQLTCANDYLKDNLAQSLRQKERDILFTRYSHVAGYHGCRPKDPTSYTSKGILPSNTEVLISEARSLFVGIEGFDEALQDIKEWYLNHNEGKVGLLFSALRAHEDHNPYVRGSELIRGLANRLGEIAKSRHAGTGKPTLIKCAIPVGWLDTHTTFATSGAYSNWVLKELIRMRKWPHDNFIGCEGGYMLTRAVPQKISWISLT